MRRLDPWAALLLGVLLALGVVMLLATPGPWQRVVGKEPPVRLEAPAPDDIAVFVLGGRGGSCSGVIWLHLGPAESTLSAVVVAPRISGFAPGDGSAPLAAVVDAAGARAGAAALGRALGVDMDAWVALDSKALELAVEPMFSMNEVRAPRTRRRETRAAWRGEGGPERVWATQYETLLVALPQVAFSELGVVAFSNYVLGFGAVESDLTLQSATSLGEALQAVDPGRVSVRAAPVIAERCRGGEVWHLDASRVEPLRQSLVFGLTPPETDASVARRARRGARARRRTAAVCECGSLRRRGERSPGPLGRSPGRGHAGGRRRRQPGVARRAGAGRASGAGRARRAGAGKPAGDGRGRRGVHDAAQPRPGGRRRRTAVGARERSRRLRRRGPARGRHHRQSPAGLVVAGDCGDGRCLRAATTACRTQRAPTCRRLCAPAGRVPWRRTSARRGSGSRSSRPATPRSAS